MNPNAQNYARNGAAALDEQYPGWVDKIDLDRLKMSDPHLCVLGQLYGSWFPYGLDELYLGDDPGNFGFILGPLVYDYHELDEAWKEVINVRRQLQQSL